MKTIWQIKNVTSKRVQLLGAAYDDATKELEITDVETDDKIVVFLDDIKNFELQITKIIDLIKKIDPNKPKSKSNFIKKIRENYPNAYKIWSSEEIDKLKKMFNQKKTYSEISKSLGRKKGAIISKLRLEKLIDDKEFLKHYRDTRFLDKLKKGRKKNNINVDIDESDLLDV